MHNVQRVRATSDVLNRHADREKLEILAVLGIAGTGVYHVHFHLRERASQRDVTAAMFCWLLKVDVCWRNRLTSLPR